MKQYNDGKPFTKESWKFEPIAKGLWKISLSTKSITLGAGTTITTQLTIPFPVRWLRACFLHTDAAYTPTTTSEITITLRRQQAQIQPAQFTEYLFYIEASVEPYITKPFEDWFKYESSLYEVIVTANIAGELFFPVLYVEELEV